jgi:DNA-binding IclR family transcriptional regulator
MPSPLSVADAVERLKSLFLEMPGTQLTETEAARLAGIDASHCRTVLDTLQRAGFLDRRGNGTFVRRGSDSPAA